MLDPAPHRPVTLHEVAQVAGVSVITASRAVSKPHLVSEATLARVREAVERTGYVRNLMAGGLKSARTRTVAALVPALAVAQFLPTLQTLTDTLEAEGYQLILGQSGYGRSREDALIHAMIGRRPDGVVVTGLIRSPASRERLQRAGIPVVETWDLSDQPVDRVVGFSHVKVGAALGGYFLRKGWHRVGVASGDDERALARRDGFQSAFGRELPTAIVEAPSGLASGRQALTALLQQDPGLRAVACSSDQMAQGVITEAQCRGLRVPQDLAVSGFGDADFSAHMAPALTTVQVDGRHIGELAARLIMGRYEAGAAGPRITDVGFHIVERASTFTG